MLLGWCGFASLFSIWRYNSLLAVQALTYSFAVFLGISAFAGTPHLVRRLIQWCGFFAVFTSIIVLIFGDKTAPRLVMPFGSYGDPNELGMAMLAGLPLIWYSARFSRWPVTRLAFLVAQIPVLVVLVKTGSRGSMVALAMLIVVSFLKMPLLGKIKLVLASAAGVGLFFMFGSAYLKARLTTLFEPNLEKAEGLTVKEYEYLLGDVGSAEARRALLKDSITTTLEQPLVGVGPGNFGLQRWLEFKEQTGRNIPQQPTHNAFTQLSSEAGIPALLLFLGVIYTGFRNVRRFPSGFMPATPEAEEMEWAAFWVKAQMISLFTGAFFLSLGYSGPHYMALGIAQAVGQARNILREGGKAQ